MEEAKGPSGSLMAGHGPESWLSRWERQCLEEDERQGLGPECAAGGAETEAQKQRLWLSFQNSASAVAQLYKDRVYQQQLGIQSLWKPFQAAATSVTCVYKDGLETYRASLDLGVQGGYQRRNKEMLAWARKRRHVIHREDLLSFLCRKSPPSRSSRLAPRLNIASSGLGVQEDSSRTAEGDLQAFTDAIAVHGLNGAMANVSVRSATPGSPSHSGSNSASARRRSLHDVDLNSFIAEEMARHLESSRKRTPTQCNDVLTEPPSHKRSRML